jgi:predicted nucleic acid-binding protein
VTPFVLDASVALAWFIDNPVPSYAVKIRENMSAGGRAIVPAIWHLEIANALVVVERRKIIEADDVLSALNRIDQLLTGPIESRPDFVSVREVLKTARTFELSAYDAVYLDTARMSGLPLATLDKSLRSAATRAGVQLAS